MSLPIVGRLLGHAQQQTTALGRRSATSGDESLCFNRRCGSIPESGLMSSRFDEIATLGESIVCGRNLHTRVPARVRMR
jgi:hypothetical protein